MTNRIFVVESRAGSFPARKHLYRVRSAEIAWFWHSRTFPRSVVLSIRTVEADDE